jgi:hypothetical protein
MEDKEIIEKLEKYHKSAHELVLVDQRPEKANLKDERLLYVKKVLERRINAFFGDRKAILDRQFEIQTHKWLVDLNYFLELGLISFSRFLEFYAMKDAWTTLLTEEEQKLVNYYILSDKNREFLLLKKFVEDMKMLLKNLIIIIKEIVIHLEIIKYDLRVKLLELDNLCDWIALNNIKFEDFTWKFLEEMIVKSSNEENDENSRELKRFYDSYYPKRHIIFTLISQQKNFVEELINCSLNIEKLIIERGRLIKLWSSKLQLRNSEDFYVFLNEDFRIWKKNIMKDISQIGTILKYHNNIMLLVQNSLMNWKPFFQKIEELMLGLKEPFWTIDKHVDWLWIKIKIDEYLLILESLFEEKNISYYLKINELNVLFKNQYNLMLNKLKLWQVKNNKYKELIINELTDLNL